jgi:hypothetical protein
MWNALGATSRGGAMLNWRGINANFTIIDERGVL